MCHARTNSICIFFYVFAFQSYSRDPPKRISLSINLFNKILSIKNTRIRIWINEYSGTFATDRMIVYCQICDKKVPCSKKFQIVLHIRTATHII